MNSYPAGYQDPPWDGSTEEFRDIVLPARVAAIAFTLSSLLPPGYEFAFLTNDGSEESP